MFQEFKAFILRGNVLDLAVAVIIAGAFGAIVTSLVNDVLMPPVGMALGGVDFSELKYVLSAATEADEEVAIRYGAFIQKIINFLIIAAVIFAIIKTYNRTKKKEEAKPDSPAKPTEVQLLQEIRDLLQNR